MTNYKCQFFSDHLMKFIQTSFGFSFGCPFNLHGLGLKLSTNNSSDIFALMVLRGGSCKQHETIKSFYPRKSYPRCVKPLHFSWYYFFLHIFLGRLDQHVSGRSWAAFVWPCFCVVSSANECTPSDRKCKKQTGVRTTKAVGIGGQAWKPDCFPWLANASDITPVPAWHFSWTWKSFQLDCQHELNMPFKVN